MTDATSIDPTQMLSGVLSDPTAVLSFGLVDEVSASAGRFDPNFRWLLEQHRPLVRCASVRGVERSNWPIGWAAGERCQETRLLVTTSIGTQDGRLGMVGATSAARWPSCLVSIRPTGHPASEGSRYYAAVYELTNPSIPVVTRAMSSQPVRRRFAEFIGCH
jgi:hypothetical protein